MEDIHERIPSPPSLLIAAHCSTIQRKAQRLDAQELSAILDDISRELNTTNLRSATYLNSLNEIVKSLNTFLPPILPIISSNYFFILIRNTIRNLLQKLSQTKRLSGQEIYVLRNCILLLDHLVDELPDVSKVLYWITDVTFLDALADCLNRIDKILKKNSNRNAIKQIARLVNIFGMIQERLPLDLHQTLFVRLLQPTINCLTSLNYIKFFENFQSNADSLTENQKLFLLKCPYFLTTYNGPHIEKAMEQVLEVMLPRYVAILDKHIQTIKQWKRPIMRAIHNLIITIVYGEGYFSSYIYTESFRLLINHLLTILNESTLIKKIHPNSNNIETLLIDATLVVFNVLIYEPNALDFIKQRKPSKIFRKLTKTPYETIVLNAYMMLAYTIDDNDIKASSNDLIKLFSTTFNLLQKTMNNSGSMNTDRSTLQLLETLKGLAQYEQVRNEIFKQGLLTFLIDSYKKFHGLSKQVLLECLWKLAFYEPIAQQLREHSQFILLLESLPKPINDNIPSNALRRSNSFSSRRNSVSVVLMEATNHGIQKVADGLLWKVIKEPQFREKMKKPNDQQKYKYDIMISYCSADKDIVHNVQQFLVNEGYNIWSERNHNNEQAMEIVAEAIENSEFVIVCMSDSYKRDNHCQAQAEYALISKRILLPLIVHSGYKPDGWLNALLNNHVPIDFGTGNFKTASELLLKEIKQRQHKKEISDVKQTMLTSTNTVRNSAVPLIVSDKPPISVESSVSSTTVDRQQGSARSNSRPPTPGAIYTVAPITAFKQQQQQASIQPTFTPLAPDSIPTSASIAVDKQQPPTASTQPVSRSATPAVTSFSTSTNIIQQQTLGQSVSRPSTPGSIASIASGIGDKQQQQQQQQLSNNSISRSAAANPIYSVAPVVVNQQYQQELQMVPHPVERSSTPSSVSSDASVTTGTQRRLTPVHTVSEPFVPDSGAPITSTKIDRQPQTSARPLTPGSSVSAASIAQPLIQTSASSTTIIDVDKQQQQTNVNSILKSSTSSAAPSDVSVNIEKKQQEQQQPTRSATKIPVINTVPSTAYTAIIQKQSMQPVIRSFSTSVLPDMHSTTAQRQHQTPVQSNSIPSGVSIIDDKQQRQISVHSTPKSSIPAFADIENQRRQSSHSNSRPTIPASDARTTYVNIEKQQLPSRSNSRTTMPNSGVPATSIGIEKQQQRVPSQANSRSTTPAVLPNGSSTNLALLTSLQINNREQIRLPTEYTNRKTNNSIYRTLSIDVWRNNDVLDFLFDTHLYMMMPLCESMSGRALLRLFRMCHRKPSRLYDQLNEELRIRFKGLTLPMGVYTQFLIEMDALMGPASDTLSSVSDTTPKVVERVIFMSRPVQQQQPIAIQPSPRPSTITSNQSKTATPVDFMSGTTTPHTSRIVERAVYRPASNIGRPYNFIIESAEESNILLDQVQRYGNQLLLLDAAARQHRERNSSR